MKVASHVSKMFEASKATFESSEKAAEQALTATAAKIANVEAKANLNAATEVFNAANYEKNIVLKQEPSH